MIFVGMVDYPGDGAPEGGADEMLAVMVCRSICYQTRCSLRGAHGDVSDVGGLRARCAQAATRRGAPLYTAPLSSSSLGVVGYC